MRINVLFGKSCSIRGSRDAKVLGVEFLVEREASFVVAVVFGLNIYLIRTAFE